MSATYDMYPDYGRDWQGTSDDDKAVSAQDARNRRLEGIANDTRYSPRTRQRARDLIAEGWRPEYDWYFRREVEQERDRLPLLEVPVKRYCQRCGVWEEHHGPDHTFLANDDVGEVHTEPVDWEGRAKDVLALFDDVNWLRLVHTPLHQIRDEVRRLLNGEEA